jgi:hypothetical protein
MSCNAMHPIQDLVLEDFSYVLQIDMHFICTPMWTKFYSCKKWVLHDTTYHTPVLKNRAKASIRVPRMFKSHALQQYDKQMKCFD